jgi:hypothetical protein
MATVAKTVYYAWPTLTASSAVAALTGSGANQFYTITASLGTKTLYFPETSSRNFKSVGVEIGWMDGLSVVQSINGYNITLQISGSSITSSYNYLSTIAGDANTIGNSGENWSMVLGPFDFTNYFNSNIPAQSSSIDVDLNIYWRTLSSISASNTSSAAYNYTAKLFATYEHENNNNTYIKTAIIPFNSPTSSLGITGINTSSFIDYIPQLTGVGGFLPESNVVIRDYFIEIEGNETTGAGINIFLTSSITSSTYNSVYQFGLIQRALQSDRFDRFMYSIPTSSLPDTTVTHSLNLAANTATAFRHISPSLYVTYEYDKTTTSKILNTILIPEYINSPLGYPVEPSSSFVDKTFRILDNNLELKQSALRLNWFDTATITTLRIKTGGQSSFKTYNDFGSAICGMKNVQHRIDSGAEYGSGFTLVRGLNEISSSIFTTSTTQNASNVTGLYIINYHSDVPSTGIDNSTKFHIFSDRTFTSAVNNTSLLYTSSIPLTVSSSTYIIDNGNIFYNLVQNPQGYTYDAKILPNENGVGYKNIYNDVVITDVELGSSYSIIEYKDYFARYSEAPSSSYLNPWINRQFRILTLGTRLGFERFMNLSRYTYPLSGSIYNYTGDGSGYIVDIYDNINNQLLYTLTTTIGGKFNTTWYDDTNLMYAKVTTPTQYGISNRITVTGSFDVYLIPFEYGYSNI